MNGTYEGNEMHGMMQQSFTDGKISKTRELNDSMSIDTSKSEDRYGQQVHSLSKQSYSNETEEV